MSAYKQYAVVEWRPTDKSLRDHKVSLIDSCSFGELHKCELVAENQLGDFKMFGGFIDWFFIDKIQRQIEKTIRGLEMRLNPRFNGVIDSARLEHPHG